MAIFKPRITTPIINLDVSFDQRTNNEVLNIGDVSTKLVCFNLENADLFNSYAVQTRNGTQDLSGGIANLFFNAPSVIDLENNLPSGTTQTFEDQFVGGAYYDYIGLIIIPSGDFNIYSGTLSLSSHSTNSVPPSGSSLADYNVRMYLYSLDQASFPASGVSFMSGTTAGTEAILHDIALSGNYNSPPYPQYGTTFGTALSLTLPTPIAITNRVNTVDLGAFSGTTGDWSTATSEVNWQFEAPFQLHSGSVYFLQNYVDTTGVQAGGQNLRINSITNTTTDISPNTKLGEEFYFGGLPANQPNAIRPRGSDKNWLKTDIHEYQGAGYILTENKTASADITVQLKNGITFNGSQAPENVVTVLSSQGGPVFNGANNIPPIDTTAQTFGQVFTVPSGSHNLYGSYFYATANDRPSTFNYSLAKTPVSGNGYNMGYICKLSTIDTSTGSKSAGNLNITASTVIASYSGTYVFGDNINNIGASGMSIVASPGATPPNYALNKIYSIFDNPVTVSGSTNTDYLLTWSLYNPADGLPITDYTYRNITSGFFAGTTVFQSFIQVGFDETSVNPSGIFVVNYNGDGSTFECPSGTSYYGSPKKSNLTCGLIEIPSNNGITLIYDYTISDLRNQKVIYGQQDKLSYSTFANPEATNWTVIHSGAATDNNALWSAVTFDDLFFAHQYSQSEGQVWSTTYSGVSYEHGKRPTAMISGLSVSGSTIASGLYNFLLATSMDSGGFRSSDTQASGLGISPSGLVVASGEWIHISNLNMTNQYPFDLSTTSTNIFMTEASGSVFYEPVLRDAPNGSVVPQPIANNVTDVYIGVPINTVVDQPVLNALEPPYPQSYLTFQIKTPKFKKLIEFYNYLIGVGNPLHPSTIYHTPIEEPQIWGTDGEFAGTVNVQEDDGGIITGVEKLKQFLILYKNNGCFRVEFVETGGIPFFITPISPNVGNLGFFSTVSTDNGVYGLSQFGPTLCNGSSIEIIGQEIFPWFKTLDHTDLQFAVAIHDQASSIITWSIGNDNSNPDNQTALVLNYKENSWIVRKGQTWNAAGIVHDPDQFNQVWIGNILGEVKRDNVGNVDTDTLFNDGNGVSLLNQIQLVMETPWLSFKDSTNKKIMRFLGVNTERCVGQELYVDCYLDYSTTPAYTRIVDLDSDYPDKRVNLGGQAKLIKFIFYNVGTPAKVKINRLTVEYQELGNRDPA